MFWTSKLRLKLIDILYKCASSEVLYFRIYEVVKLDQPPSIQMKLQDNAIQKATLADARFLSVCGHSTTKLHQWLQQGVEGWYIQKEKELLTCTWIDFNDTYHLYPWLALQASSEIAWIYWWWVAPEYRGKGVAYRILPYKQNKTICRMAVIDSLNRRSLYGAYKLGWKSINRIIVIQLHRLKIIWLKDHINLGKWEAARPLRLFIE